jgi:translation elongation factor EF-1alpha
MHSSWGRLSMISQQFIFTVQHVFYIKPPVDRVILVGTVEQGTIRQRDAVLIWVTGKAIPATVDGIERIRVGDIPSASAGDQVGLRFAGIPLDQVKPGDRITNDEGAAGVPRPQ